MFHKFLFFSTYIFLLQLLCFAENTIKIVFSGNHSFQNTVSKNLFFTHAKKTPFSKECFILGFGQISAETTIFIVFPGFHCFGPKKSLAKTDSVHENVRFSSPFLTQIVSGKFC